MYVCMYVFLIANTSMCLYVQASIDIYTSTHTATLGDEI